MRRGFVLPLVMVAISAASLLVLAFTADVWRATVAGQGSVIGDDAAYEADAALATALDRWRAESLWVVPPGRVHHRTVDVAGRPVDVYWERPQPLLAIVRAIRTPAVRRRLAVTVRDHLRAVWLEPPPLPVPATVATNGPLSGEHGTAISGSDAPGPGSPCGARGDTAALPAVMARIVTTSTGDQWVGGPVPVAPSSDFVAAVDRALTRVAGYTESLAWGTAPRPLPSASGWRALRLLGGPLAVAGPSRWHGLLVAEGDLTLDGVVEITGLLVVRGRFDATRGVLAVRGALVVADSLGRGVALGPLTRITFDRCAVELALATVAQPSAVPLSLWHRLPR